MLRRVDFSPTIRWFSFSLSIAAMCGILAIFSAFSSESVVQDDARSHVVWMLRFLDPGLFPNDPIMDYFQSVSPDGYAILYRIAAFLGINPPIFNKLLPLVLGSIATSYCFAVCLQIFPVPLAGFLGSVLLNESLWLKDDLVSATPRAFFYPLFLAFLYYLLKRSVMGTSIAIALLGLFYPQGVLLCTAVLLIHSLRLPLKTQDARWLLVSLTVAFIVLLPYALSPSTFGPVITLTEAKTLPEFWPGGRASFFTDKPWDFWLKGDRSGFFPREWVTKLPIPPQVWAGLLLPLLLRFPATFPLGKRATHSIWILPQLAIASAFVFGVAHLFAFKLHHPSRYTQHSLRIILAIAAGIALAILFETLYQKFQQQLAKPTIKAIALILAVLVIIYPCFGKQFPNTNYVVGRVPSLYEFLNQQPKDTLIASLAVEANNLPAFAHRSILVGSEYVLPYHKKYYIQMQQRSRDLIVAQYSSDRQQVRDFIQQYGIDFWLLDSDALTLDYALKNHRIRELHVAASAEIQENLRRGNVPALSKAIDRCTVWKAERLILLETQCIVKENG